MQKRTTKTNLKLVKVQLNYKLSKALRKETQSKVRVKIQSKSKTNLYQKVQIRIQKMPI